MSKFTYFRLLLLVVFAIEEFSKEERELSGFGGKLCGVISWFGAVAIILSLSSFSFLSPPTNPLSYRVSSSSTSLILVVLANIFIFFCEFLPINFPVGYSTCHWCHVMEVESFESEEVAKLVSIKVDRVIRPDVDMVIRSDVDKAGCQTREWGC
ncbi:uncharacterized protein [Spinacia oleracea]|uniref:Spermatogenesis-associated protein 20-like TRX domain-containing protein n=1 Tax=Spinacia oleracea TaxID=3562 RepID=A0ABM3QR48_SPIOL|nr:uncharacterized protein LOC130461699 [Spinacia oleracea]